MPIFESVRQTSCLEANLRESGSPIFLLGALQFVSDFKRRARKAERDAVYTCITVKSAKSLLSRLSTTLRMRENQ